MLVNLREFEASAEFAVSTAKTVLYIAAPSTCVVIVAEVLITNTDQDSAEMFQVGAERYASGSISGTDATEVKLDPGSAAPSATVTVDLGSEPTYTAGFFGRRGFSSQAGYRYSPPRGLVLGPSDGVGFKTIDAPVSSFGMAVYIRWGEIGG